MKTTGTERAEVIAKHAESASSVKNGKKKIKWRDELLPFIFIGPHLVFFVVFILVPFIFGIAISFTSWDMVGSPEFIGFKNYVQIFSDTVFSDEFWQGLGATMIYVVVMVPLLIAVPLLFACLLLKVTRGRAVMQSVLYISSILSVSAVVLMWRWLFDRESGAINLILGLDINWAGDYAWLCIFILSLWSGIGGNMVIFMSGLSGIPSSYYEAADLDGANAFVKFWKITLPSMRFPLLYTTVMTTIGAFNVYGQPALFGGPENTQVLMIHIQKRAFGSDISMAGIASTMSVLFGIIIVVFSALQFKLQAKD